jgi:anti-sigma factor RsiW
VSEPELSCQALVELATEYLEGALSAAQARCLEDHVVECADCARFVGQLELTIGALRELSAWPRASAASRSGPRA